MAQIQQTLKINNKIKMSKKKRKKNKMRIKKIKKKVLIFDIYIKLIKKIHYLI